MWVDAPLTFYLNPVVAERLGLTSTSTDGQKQQLAPEDVELLSLLQRVNNTESPSSSLSLVQLRDSGLLRVLDGLSGVSEGGAPAAVASGTVRQQMRVEPKTGTLDGDFNQPRNLTSLTFVFSAPACGMASALTTEAVRRSLTGPMGQLYGTPSTTLQYTLKVCSRDMLQLYGEAAGAVEQPGDDAAAFATWSKNLVLGPVGLPAAGACAGVNSAGVAYDLAASCGEPEMEALYDLALEWLKQNRPVVFGALPFYTHKLLLAALPGCGGAASSAPRGYFSTGCRGLNCRSWLIHGKDDTEIQPATLFHGLGHHFGVAHAAGQFSPDSVVAADVADPTDPMGSAGAMTCFAAPNAFLLGWSSPIAIRGQDDPWAGHTFAITHVAPGGFTEHVLPAAALSQQNTLRIAVGQAGLSAEAVGFGQKRALYLSYRVAQPAPGYDSGLPPVYDRRVWIHESNETASWGIPVATGSHSLLLAMLGDGGGDGGDVATPPAAVLVADVATEGVDPWVVGDRFVHRSSDPAATGGHLVIKLIRQDAESATVGLCRFEQEVENTEDACTNGWDDDCDGLLDMEDPDCQALEG